MIVTPLQSIFWSEIQNILAFINLGYAMGLKGRDIFVREIREEIHLDGNTK